MAPSEDKPEGGPDKHAQARRLAEAALREEVAGNDAEAERLFDQAVRTDPEAAADVLAEHEVALRADVTDRPVSDEEVAAITETVTPRNNARPPAGITDYGSGADNEKR